jgi:hypothetical protein
MGAFYDVVSRYVVVIRIQKDVAVEHVWRIKCIFVSAASVKR